MLPKYFMLYWSIMLSHGDFSRVKKFNVKRDVSPNFQSQQISRRLECLKIHNIQIQIQLLTCYVHFRTICNGDLEAIAKYSRKLEQLDILGTSYVHADNVHRFVFHKVIKLNKIKIDTFLYIPVNSITFFCITIFF